MLNYEKFSLLNLLNQVQDHFKVLLNNKKIKFYLKNEIQTHFDYTLQSDEFRIKSLLIILIENAVKFTTTGKIILTVFQGFNQSIKFQILDTGIGIPENKYFLFETSLDQLAPSNQTVNELGMGIGLYYAKKLLKSLGPTDRINILNRKSTNSFKIEDGIGSIIEFTIFSDLSKSKYKTKSYNFMFFDNNSDCFSEQKIPIKKLTTLVHQTYEQDSSDSAPSKQNLNSSYCTSSEKQQEVASNFDDMPDCEDPRDFLSSQKWRNFPNPKLFNQQTIKQQSFLSISSPVQEHKTLLKPKIITQFKKQGVYPFNILIVDDASFNLAILQTFIKQSKTLKFNTLEASNGEQALTVFKSSNQKPNVKNIDIIIMDCDMPIMNGYEACFAIKQLITDHNYINVKIVAFSCYQGEEQQILCEKAKFDGILQKPCTLDIFLKYIERLILIA